MSISREDLVERIMAALDKKGLNRTKLYEIAPSGTISAWKTKRQKPSAYTLFEIAKFVGESLDYLLTGSDGLTETEHNLLDAYRNLNDVGKKAAIDAVRDLYASFPQPLEQGWSLIVDDNIKPITPK
ncbi:MAG: helix-turn-helix domain-containing protein [Treponema sp.]|jgi:transcriptional regulator with XRE-family HTH domain|nr:helix-turn-helix domain-containing protein [Treponema sp.]